ncbi:MAG TPA: type III secretion system inner rod subunit SctI [Usitatibacter sp.]|nr:type III secretion system inner rod subunit SctI [Usitatibacter sp.]
MEPIGGIAMQGALVAQVEATRSPGAADAVEAMRFAEMVHPAEIPVAAAAPALDAPLAVRTPGDSILEGMKGLGSDFRDTWSAMRTALAQPMDNLTLADMLRLQMQMMQLSVQVEMVGKAISKSTQNIDQLSKLQ